MHTKALWHVQPARVGRLPEQSQLCLCHTLHMTHIHGIRHFVPSAHEGSVHCTHITSHHTNTWLLTTEHHLLGFLTSMSMQRCSSVAGVSRSSANDKSPKVRDPDSVKAQQLLAESASEHTTQVPKACQAAAATHPLHDDLVDLLHFGALRIF